MLETESGWYVGFWFSYSIAAFGGVLCAVAMTFVEKRKFVPEKYYKYSKWGLDS